MIDTDTLLLGCEVEIALYSGKCIVGVVIGDNLNSLKVKKDSRVIYISKQRIEMLDLFINESEVDIKSEAPSEAQSEAVSPFLFARGTSQQRPSNADASEGNKLVEALRGVETSIRQEEHYGSTIPEDMLIGDSSRSNYVDLSLTMQQLSNPENTYEDIREKAEGNNEEDQE